VANNGSGIARKATPQECGNVHSNQRGDAYLTRPIQHTDIHMRTKRYVLLPRKLVAAEEIQLAIAYSRRGIVWQLIENGTTPSIRMMRIHMSLRGTMMNKCKSRGMYIDLRNGCPAKSTHSCHRGLVSKQRVDRKSIQHGRN
jgi:hypothetical protein